MTLKYDIIIAIDFGTTSTGVSWRIEGSKDVKTLKWEKEVKIPSLLLINKDGDTVFWGLEARNKAGADESLLLIEWMKLNLGQDSAAHPGQVEHHVTEFLRHLYGEISGPRLSELVDGSHVENKEWDSLAIRFLFSVPTTWRSNPNTIGSFYSCIRAAGFGTLDEHTVETQVEEPQAAAVYHFMLDVQTMNPHESFFAQKRTVLAIDAGGGTTDLCLLNIRRDEDRPKITTVNPGTDLTVPGVRAGSSFIDTMFEDLVKSILEPARRVLADPIGNAAYQARVADMFQVAKHNLGTPKSMSRYKQRVPGLDRFDNPDNDRIADGCVVFTRGDLERLFDEQVGIIADKFSEASPKRNDHLDAILLSGGFGGSEYVRKKLKALCDTKFSPGQVKVIIPEEPRIAVCAGLAYWSMFADSFPAPPCPLSLGVVVVNPQSSDKDKKQVVWFISKGDPIPAESLQAKYFAKREWEDFENKETTVKVAIVADSSKNPSNDFHDGLRVVTTLTAKVTEHQPKSGPIKRSVGKESRPRVKFRVKLTLNLLEASFRCFDKRGPWLGLGDTVNLKKIMFWEEKKAREENARKPYIERDM